MVARMGDGVRSFGTALVTGASSGIGAALAEALASGETDLVLAARRTDRLGEVADRCRAAGGEATIHPVDLADRSAALGLVDEAWDRLDGIDLVVNNAGMPKRRSVLDLDQAEIDRVMAVNFVAPALISQAAARRMAARGRGTIVNVASLGGRLGIPDEAAYCASKFALCGWTESMALDLWHTPVDVRLFVPGPVETEIWDRPDNDPPRYDGPKESPEAVARAMVAFLATDRFEAYEPDLKAVVEFKTSDIDGYLQGAIGGLGDAR